MSNTKVKGKIHNISFIFSQKIKLDPIPCGLVGLIHLDEKSSSKAKHSLIQGKVLLGSVDSSAFILDVLHHCSYNDNLVSVILGDGFTVESMEILFDGIKSVSKHSCTNIRH